MTDPLVKKYRPSSFKELVGQRMTAVVLQRMVAEDMVPPALLFSGPSGVGKTTAARLLIDAMKAEGSLEVDAASNGGVAEVRKLIEVVQYSTGGPHRVLILDEAHSITPQGFEALLKVLEEPPEKTVFVLCSTEPHRIPKNVRSRLIEFRFHPVTTAQIHDRLMAIVHSEHRGVEPQLLSHIAQQAGGDLRSATWLLDMSLRAEVFTLESFLKLTAASDPGPELMQALVTGDHAEIFDVLDRQVSTIADPAQIQQALISTIRDLFVLRAGGTLTVQAEALEVRKTLARQLEPERLMYAVKTLWEMRTKLRTSNDGRGNLELALILIAEAFTRGRVAPKPSVTSPAISDKPSSPATAEVAATPIKLSLADLQRSQ